MSLAQVQVLSRVADEPGLVELADGTLVMFLRTDQGRIFKATSMDKGLSWSEAAEIPGLDVADAPATLKVIPGSGRHILIYNQAGANLDVNYRNTLALAISQDGCQTFTKVLNIEDNSTINAAYPCVVFDGTNAIVSYWIRDYSNGNLPRANWLSLKTAIVPLVLLGVSPPI